MRAPSCRLSWRCSGGLGDSWAVIFKKGRVISYSIRQADHFETAFWSGGDLSTLYRNIETKGREGTGEQSIFESGFGEFSRLRQQGLPTDQLLEGARRAMRVAQMREQDRLERNLADARHGRIH